LTYLLTASSLEQRDRQIIQGKLGEYASVYTRGGITALADTVQAEQRTAPERLFVRVLDRGTVSTVLSNPTGWDPSTLELASLRGAAPSTTCRTICARRSRTCAARRKPRSRRRPMPSATARRSPTASKKPIACS